jgi:energy-coupling factor transport system permease protein
VRVYANTPLGERGSRTREAVLVAVLGVVFGFLYYQWTSVWLAIGGVGTQVSQEALFGFWSIAGVLAAYIVRRPGAALVGEVLATVVQVLLGGAADRPLLIGGVMHGLGAEIVFAAGGWRDYARLTVMLAGAASMLVALPWDWQRLGYFQLDIDFLVLLLLVRLASGAVLGGLLAKLLVRLSAGRGP